jgi:hypothetical protein
MNKSFDPSFCAPTAAIMKRNKNSKENTEGDGNHKKATTKKIRVDAKQKDKLSPIISFAHLETFPDDIKKLVISLLPLGDKVALRGTCSQFRILLDSIYLRKCVKLHLNDKSRAELNSIARVMVAADKIDRVTASIEGRLSQLDPYFSAPIVEMTIFTWNALNYSALQKLPPSLQVLKIETDIARNPMTDDLFRAFEPLINLRILKIFRGSKLITGSGFKYLPPSLKVFEMDSRQSVKDSNLKFLPGSVKLEIVSHLFRF